ncbi:MATE family efflux transporter [Terribacillus halophilus]|jgi:multidrug resistance protein, MATE family|uniref:MATE family efflux transporter n=1 Tax=Terribacillus halophilus TaxID=361279 RepID=UPI000984A3F6|nr:MATE family efflux transporter [Terribacillus halophilus]
MQHKQYLALALPLTLSTITTPLLGVVDTAVVGQLSNSSYIGGVAIGTIIFNTMYWLFGFLRVSTSGFAAQASTSLDTEEHVMALLRPFAVAFLVGLLFVLIQQPILHYSLSFLGASEAVNASASAYFSIRIWGAPFALANYVILGWLIGMSYIKATLILQISTNVLNILLCILAVHVWDWGVTGVGASTLIAEIFSCVFGFLLLRKYARSIWQHPLVQLLKRALDPKPMWQMMKVNRDLFIRTICLLVVFNLFTANGAAFGEDVLAANAILIQVHYMMAYFFDGFANASSIAAGRALGERNEKLFSQSLRLSLQWGLGIGITLALVFLAGKQWMYPFFSDQQHIIDLTSTYANWLVLFPIVASLGLVYYGVFTGMTEVRFVRNSMILAVLLYLAALFSLQPLGNHGLWLAFLLFSLGRSVFLILYVPKLRRLFKQTAAA